MIQTPNLSNQAAAGPCFRPHGHWDWHVCRAQACAHAHFIFLLSASILYNQQQNYYKYISQTVDPRGQYYENSISYFIAAM